MQTSKLTLGWEVTPTLEPRYWVNNTNAKVGAQSENDLVTVSSELLGTHTTIIAQSGAGKSFFLGRLIEEMMIKTKCRCVVLDPNADFRRIHEIEPAELWSKASYNQSTRRGKLPHEKKRLDFEKEWKKVGIRIYTSSNSIKLEDPYKKLSLWWPNISIELISSDIDPIHRSDLYHCHRFVKAISNLALSYSQHRPNAKHQSKQFDILTEAQKFLKRFRSGDMNVQKELSDYFNVEEPTRSFGESIRTGRIISFSKILKRARNRRSISVAESALNHISPEIEHFYFGKVLEYKAEGILETKTENKNRSERNSDKIARLEVVDLPSLQDKNTRLLAISSIINGEWDRAQLNWNDALREKPEQDKRVPTFIVVDEAHNLMPAEVRSNSEYILREKFRTIIAEGRKYGLFLILVSQRPDKLDPLIVSECENRAIMKISSVSVLDSTKKMLGLDEVPKKDLEKCLDFPSGRVLLVGQWAGNNHKFLYAAARRTIEGGRNLRQDFWATVP